MSSTGVNGWSRIENLFHTALGIRRSQRIDFISKACPNDPDLRDEVRTLLARAEVNDSFLEKSPISLLQETSGRIPLGSVIGNFEIIDFLGEGGMGEVYKARDTRLNRAVAIKRSRTQFSAHFLNEARAAAALNHPHICTLFDIGPDYLVMEFISGETLQEELARSPIPLERALPLAIQLCDALETAHRHGVVHRDLKPANIMVARTGIKILDFGLAQTNGLDAEENGNQTRSGALLGTLPYIAPELLEGKPSGPSTDIFALGLIIYEMLTGRQPFARDSEPEAIRALLTDDPAITGIPMRLARIVRKSIAKAPTARWESAGKMREALEQLRVRRSPSAVLTAAIPALLASGIGASLVFRTPHPKPLTGQDVVVLSDFTNSTADPVFDGTLREALALQLEESPFLKIAEENSIRQDLQAMGKSAGTKITDSIALELCQRNGGKAIISGSIAPLGKAFLINIRALACATGQTLTREQVQAQDKEHVLEAVARGAAGLRHHLGESLASIPKPLHLVDGVTTPSLDALQALTLAVEAAQKEGAAVAIPLLMRAVQLDPNFAAAYERLAIQYNKFGEYKKEAEYYAKAFALSAGLPEKERLSIAAGYYLRSRGDLEKAIEVTRLESRLYPRESTPNNLLGGALRARGELEAALDHYEEASRLDPGVASFRSNVLRGHLSLGRVDLAKRTAEAALSANLNPPMFHRALLAIAYLQRDMGAAKAQIEWFEKQGDDDQALAIQASNSATLGRLREARDLWRKAAAISTRNNQAQPASVYADDEFIARALSGECLTVRTRAVSTSLLAIALTLCGQVRPDGEWKDQLAQGEPMGTLWNAVYLPSIYAAQALRRGALERAIEMLEPAVGYERTYTFVSYLRGLAYLRRRNGPRAADEFRKLTEHKGAVWAAVYQPSSARMLYPLAMLNLARAYALEGDTAQAKMEYEQLLDLWREADPDFGPGRAARREYAALAKKL